MALYLTITSNNTHLKKSFLNKLINIKLIRVKSILQFCLLFFASMIAAIVLSTLFGYSFDQFTIVEEFSFSLGGLPTLLVLLLAAGFEELGWRGYAIESLASKLNYFKATLVFGILWSIWHLPMFFIPNSYQAELLQEDLILVVNFFISIVPLAFMISWFCKKNSGSILGAILVHFIVNITQEIFQVSPYTKCIQTIILVLIAFAIVSTNKKMFFGDCTPSAPMEQI